MVLDGLSPLKRNGRLNLGEPLTSEQLRELGTEYGRGP